MSNDKLKSIMALVEDYAEAMVHQPRFGRTTELDNLYDQIESAIREAIAAPGVAQGWQPIESAPKSGRGMILLLTPSGFPQVAFSNTWWTSGFSVECKPTRWMPIPSPTAEHPTPPATSVDEAARSLAKWLNERPNRPINPEDVAMLVHYVQSRPAIDKSQLKRLVCQVFGEDFQIVSIKGGPAE